MREFLRNGKLVTLMLGHLTVDSYVGVIPILYPVLIGKFHLTLGTVGLVSLAYSGMAAVSQPLFGVIADRFGTRLTGLSLGWTALTFALIGFVPSFPLLVLLACASGLADNAGVAAYARGGQVGLISITGAVSASFPLIVIAGSLILFRERPSARQWVGVLLTVGGLIVLGVAR